MSDFSVTTNDAGEYRIGVLPPCPAGVASLALNGALLTVDPTTPDRPSLLVGDADGIRTANQLFGVQLPLAPESSSPSATADFVATASSEARSTYDLDLCVRLAVIRWLSTWSPLPLDQELLDLEAGQLAFDLADLIDWSANVDLLRPDQTVQLSIATAQLLQESQHRSTGLPGLAELVSETLTTADALGHDVPEELLSPQPTTVSVSAYREPSMLVATPSGFLLGDEIVESAELPSGADSVEWSQVARGATDTQEDTISWRVTVDPSGDPTLEVSVPCGPSPDAESAGLIARLWSRDVALPIATAALTVIEGAWTGQARVFADPAADQDWWVDVTSARHPRPRREQIVRRNDEARRWAIRGTSALRIGLIGGVTIETTEPMREASGCFERARSVLNSLAYEDSDAVETSHAGVRERRCQVLNAAALQRMPDSYEVDEIESDLRSGSGDALLLRAPDFSHPAWHPTLAEHGLLIPTAR